MVGVDDAWSKVVIVVVRVKGFAFVMAEVNDVIILDAPRHPNRMDFAKHTVEVYGAK